MSRPKSVLKSSNPATIGMLTAWLKGPTEINLWHGVTSRAQERNVNLICFSGGIPHWYQQYESQKNILFNMAGQPNVDGLLIWANILSHSLDPSSLEAFCLRYAPLPVISMGMVFPSIPSIRIDMREGIRKLLTHIIEEHGRRKIAFIRGLEVSQDAEDRYQAYRETLQQYNLPLDPSLIVPGDFRRNSGIAAIQHLYNSHRMDFDAVVSANDNMAIGAMQALQSYGIRIPDDVIVTGFDDIEETRAVIPSLTTVRAPWHSLGRKSVDLILARLAGDQLPEAILLETQLIYRQSCGCKPLLRKELKENYHKDSAILPEIISRDEALSTRPLNVLITEIESSLSANVSTLGFDPGWSRQLIHDFLTDVRAGERESGTFIQKLGEALSRAPSGTQVIEWQEGLDAIRSRVRYLFQSANEILKAHEILETGYALVGEVAHRLQLCERLEAENQTDRLDHIVQNMSTTYDMDILMKLLADELPGLGIQSCLLSLYDEKSDSPAWSRLVLAYDGKQLLPLGQGGVRFPTRQLIPTGMLPNSRRFAFDVEALYFEDEQFGFVLFEIGPRDGDVYTTLRGHISSALKSAELVQISLDAEAKATKADQLKTHLLANVSHELRTPINIILGLSQTALSSIDSYGIELPKLLTKDLEYIYDSGEHLVRLINDLLDMSRAEIGELDLCFEPVSPHTLLVETYEAFKNTSISKKKDVEFILEIPEHLPILHADPVRLRQILMNLLSNALKFTRLGKIILGAEVQLPHLHIWVADTGSGISPALQERIFEPFVKVEPPGQNIGGIGLGLSITRRLVALHGGSITLDSQPDKGSTFHVYIPLPGLITSSAKEIDLERAQPALLWLSRESIPVPAILDLCQKNRIEPFWLSSADDIDQIIRQVKPAALAWDLANARPSDWSIIQKLRSYSQYSQLPLLLFQDNILGTHARESRITNVLLKPAGTHAFQHILQLIPPSMQSGVIWVIDDDPQALQYYQDLLSASLPEFFIRAIHGGQEAVNLLVEESPDLVLLDLLMPDIDGFQVLEHLRSNQKTALIPVIILTGKMLSYEDVKRLDSPKVVLQTKGVLSDLESVAEVQRVLSAINPLPQTTSLLIKQSMAYIQQNYSRAFSLDELAKTIGVSKSYLSRVFKIETGVSLWNYLNRFRIQKAKELLLLTGETVTEIAAAVGYDDLSYFARVFREVAGCSPRAFRQQAQALRPKSQAP